MGSSSQFAQKHQNFKSDPFSAGNLHTDFSTAIGRVNAMLTTRGFEQRPTTKYRFYNENSTVDSNIGRGFELTKFEARRITLLMLMRFDSVTYTEFWQFEVG